MRFSSQGVNHILLLEDIFLNIIVNFCLIAFNVVVDCFNSLHKLKHISFESFNFFDGERVRTVHKCNLLKIHSSKKTSALVCLRAFVYW